MALCGGGRRLCIQNHSEREMLCSIIVVLLITGKPSNYNQQQVNKEDNGDYCGCIGKLRLVG